MLTCNHTATPLGRTYPGDRGDCGGRSIAAMPVEGFTGFNPARAAGAYVVRMRPGHEPGYLDIRVTPPEP